MSVLKIRKFRKNKNLSISKLSFKSNVSRGYITELEQGKYINPGLQTICKLCKQLKITPNDLIIEELWK